MGRISEECCWNCSSQRRSAPPVRRSWCAFTFDKFGRPIGQVGDGALLELPAVSIALPLPSRNSHWIRSFHLGQRAVDGSLAPPGCRRVGRRATKFPGEMALVGEAAGNGNFGQRHFRIEEEVLGLLEAHFN